MCVGEVLCSVCVVYECVSGEVYCFGNRIQQDLRRAVYKLKFLPPTGPAEENITTVADTCSVYRLEQLITGALCY